MTNKLRNFSKQLRVLATHAEKRQKFDVIILAVSPAGSNSADDLTH